MKTPAHIPNLKKSIFRSLALAGLMAVTSMSTAYAAFSTKAPHAYLMDMQTGAVLLSKDAEEPMAPASMSKLMTVYMLLESLQDGYLSLDTEFIVSEHAWQKGGAKSGGSTMFLHPKSKVRVEDLLRGIVIQSGNDACIVAAENLAGSEADFAKRMTEKARQLGLNDSYFANATGWPDPGQLMSARDLAKLSQLIIQRFPEYYEIFSEKSFTYNGIKQGNRNPLLYRMPSADGLKTGHTESSGYGLAASAQKDGRRLILVVNGLESVKDRSAESTRLMTWGFRNFDNYTLFQKDAVVDEAVVWLGSQPSVGLKLKDDLTVTLPRSAQRNMKVSVIMNEAVPAPIAEGDEIATLRIQTADYPAIETPLYASESVERLGLTGRMLAAAKYLFWGVSK
jgi:D-alanyl-D-alanine carboxypeptidase (penicillin-binding protein 5/6)